MLQEILPSSHDREKLIAILGRAPSLPSVPEGTPSGNAHASLSASSVSTVAVAKTPAETFATHTAGKLQSLVKSSQRTISNMDAAADVPIDEMSQHVMVGAGVLNVFNDFPFGLTLDDLGQPPT